MLKILNTRRHDEQHGGYLYNIIEADVIDNGVKKHITFYRHPKNKLDWGTELYSGKNYIVGSKRTSHSRNYRRWIKLPKRYLPVAETLEKIHSRTYRKRTG